jgi:hypothetical protein
MSQSGQELFGPIDTEHDNTGIELEDTSGEASETDQELSEPGGSINTWKVTELEDTSGEANEADQELSELGGSIDAWTDIASQVMVGKRKFSVPFNPALVRVTTTQMSVDQLLRRIEQNKIDLQPDFQRRDRIWTKGAESRLIESLLLRIPLPAFYVDATNDNKWLVVDGIQRLTTLKNFVLDKTLKLCELEFLWSPSLNKKTYADIARPLQRRITETQVTVYMIEKGTPSEAKVNIFKRINTSGLPLSMQEIRNAYYQGPATEILAQLASSAEFKKAVDNSIRDERMADRECVLRFCAFTLVPYRTYIYKDFDSFLNACMETMNTMSDDETEQMKQRFLKAMDAAYSLFVTDAFRKRYKVGATRHPINKALFESWSVNLGQLSNEQIDILTERKDMLQERFIKLMNTRDFNEAISQRTGDVKKVHHRFKSIQQLIEEVLA